MENLLRPWALALLLASGGATLAWLRGLGVAVAVLRRFRPEDRDEGQIALARRAELGARWVELGALASAAAFALLIFGADHAAHEIRGAMCAHGVLASTRSGFLAAGLGLSVFVLGVTWAQLHRLDLELREPTLTRPKFIAFIALSPLALAAAAASVAFVMELDFEIVATCCSTSTDASRMEAGLPGETTRRVRFPLHLAAIVLASAAAFAHSRAPSRRRSLATGALAIAAVLAAIPALVHHVAPHIYETPAHRCPFCLLHPPDVLWGAPIYVAMFLSFFAGTALLVRGVDPRWSAQSSAPMASAKRAGVRAALALFVLAALLAAPVVRYRLAAGGASLFGS